MRAVRKKNSEPSFFGGGGTVHLGTQLTPVRPASEASLFPSYLTDQGRMAMLTTVQLLMLQHETDVSSEG